MIENQGSLFGGGEVFFLREEQPVVDWTILSARGDYSLHLCREGFLFLPCNN